MSALRRRRRRRRRSVERILRTERPQSPTAVVVAAAAAAAADAAAAAATVAVGTAFHVDTRVCGRIHAPHACNRQTRTCVLADLTGLPNGLRYDDVRRDLGARWGAEGSGGVRGSWGGGPR